jgi:GalNAc-alpha-(1->4)-GalNAc-alpha-(1->3)-diNAcBac-PP-undecaprenol alpha-1,4-N-acetyl-D-galactosaminyltransferase
VKKKKICLLIPSLQAGGMERVMVELANFFCLKLSLEIHIVLFGRIPEIFYQVNPNLFIHKPSGTFNDNLRLLSALRRLIFLRKTVRKVNPVTILSFGEYWNSFVLLALLGLSYPVYISDRCSPEKDIGRFHSWLRKWLYPKAKGIIAQTETALKIYKQQFRHNNIIVIGNPIQQIGFNDKGKHEKMILTVGRLINSKNHDKLIEVFCSINKPEWKLIVVGGDALKQKNMIRLSELISELKAGNRVIIKGYQNTINELYQQAEVFAFASVSEGFPNVIGEAMSAGLPVVAFDCVAGPSEMIQNGENGYLVPVNDYNTFRERLEQLMSDASLRKKLGMKALDSIKKYSIEIIGDKYYYFMLNQ